MRVKGRTVTLTGIGGLAVLARWPGAGCACAGGHGEGTGVGGRWRMGVMAVTEGDVGAMDGAVPGIDGVRIRRQTRGAGS
jgi:hypothetical protein